MQHAINRRQFLSAFHFKTEVREAPGPINDRGRKVEGWLVDPTIGVFLPATAWPRIEKAGIERDRFRQALDHDVHMKPCHAVTFLRLETVAGLHSTAGAHLAPPQQLSVR